jgi:hypothetical protein
MSEYLLSEGNPVVATIDPDAYTTGAQSTDSVDMLKYRRVMFIVQAGVLASSGTLDFKLQEGANSTGTWSDITSKSITQFDTGDNDGQAIVNIAAEELSATKRYVKGVMTLTTAGGDAAVVAIAGNPRYSAAATSTSYGDLASVAEIVA